METSSWFLCHTQLSKTFLSSKLHRNSTPDVAPLFLKSHFSLHWNSMGNYNPQKHEMLSYQLNLYFRFFFVELSSFWIPAAFRRFPRITPKIDVCVIRPHKWNVCMVSACTWPHNYTQNILFYSTPTSVPQRLSAQVAKANGAHKKNVWEIVRCPEYVLKCYNHLSVFVVSFGWFVGDLSAICAASALGADFVKSPRALAAQIALKSATNHPNHITKTLKRASEHFYCISVHIRDITQFPIHSSYVRH